VAIPLGRAFGGLGPGLEFLHPDGQLPPRRIGPGLPYQVAALLGQSTEDV
jgi:hypothetical protein